MNQEHEGNEENKKREEKGGPKREQKGSITKEAANSGEEHGEKSEWRQRSEKIAGPQTLADTDADKGAGAD